MAGRLTGPPTDAQVTEQVARHRDGPPAALLDEWADAASTFEDFVSQAGMWPVAIDVLAHEQDVRGAIGEPGARDVETMRLAARMLADAGLPVTLTFDLGDERLTTKDSGGPVTPWRARRSRSPASGSVGARRSRSRRWRGSRPSRRSPTGCSSSGRGRRHSGVISPRPRPGWP